MYAERKNPMNKISEKTINNEVNRKIKTAKVKKDRLPLIVFADKEKQTYINLDSEIKWTQKLTDGQRLFVYYYCNQNSVKKNAAEAVRLAGYSEKTANVQAVKFLRTPEILAEIKNVNSQLFRILTNTNLEDTVRGIIERKKRRLNMDAVGFYNIENRTTDDGFEYTSAMIKTPDQLTDEQKELIEDVEFVGQRSVPHYKLPSKIQTENELLKIYKDLKDSEKEDKDFDIETTAEIIGERLKLKTKLINSNRETAEMSELASMGAVEREEED